MKVCYTVTVPMSARAFLRGQLGHVARSGHDVVLLTGDDGGMDRFCQSESARFVNVEMKREPDPRADARSLVEMIRALRRVRPDIVVYGTPKSSLVTSLAAVLCGVRRRAYLVHGLRYESMTGRARTALIAVETLICRLSTDIVCVSESVRQRLVADVPSAVGRARVLGSGSANGVDLERFSIATNEQRFEARVRFGVERPGPVLSFVGRFNPDKGLPVLPGLVELIEDRHPDWTVLVVGSCEGDESVRTRYESMLASPCVVAVGHVDAVEEVYWASDVLILPTAREGLATVLLEAGACGVPLVSSKVTGCTDVVVEGVNGMVVDKPEAEAWYSAVHELIGVLGNGHLTPFTIRESIASRFAQERVWEQWDAFIASASSRNR